MCGFADSGDFRNAHRIEQALESGLASRDDRWSGAIAVGSLAFIETVKNDLGVKAAHRDVVGLNGSYALREPTETYAGKFTGEIEALSIENTFFWDETLENAGT